MSLLVVLALAAGLFAVGGLDRAEATFPGTNGLIAFIRAGDIFLGSDGALAQTRITFTGGIGSVNWNAGATQLTAHDGSGVFFVAPTAGAAPTRLPGGAAADNFPAYSPGGSPIVFSTGGELFTQDVNGSNRVNITNSAAGEIDPDWSADGSFIAYVNLTTGNIERRSPTGGGLVVLTPPGGPCSAGDICIGPSIFPDNSRVAFGNGGAAPTGIFSALSNGASAAAFQHTTGAEVFSAVSPDGNKIVFGVPGAGLNTDGGQVVTTTAGDSLPSWGAQQVAPSPSPGTVSPSPVVTGPGTQSGTVTRTKGGASRKQVQVCDTPVAPTPALPAGTPTCIVVAKRAGSYSRTLPPGTYTKTASTGRLKRDGTFRVKQACNLSPASPVTITSNATTTVNLVCPK